MTTTPISFAQVFGEFRAAVEAQTVECSSHIVSEVYQEHCLRCQGTGRIPDPTYATLLALVKPKWVPCSTEGMGHFVEAVRYWEAAGKGAL